MRILKNRITPTGTIFAFAGSNTPQGWLVCDGSTLLITDYPCLYDVISDTFNQGDVSSGYFMLPDLRGRTLIGTSATDISSGGTHITARSLGDLSGSETHTLTIAQMPSHNHGTNASNSVVGNGLTGICGEHVHGITDPGHVHVYDKVGQQNGTGIGVDNVGDDATTDTNTDTAVTGISINSAGSHQHTIATQGGDQPHNNMQPYLAINYIIKY